MLDFDKILSWKEELNLKKFMYGLASALALVAVVVVTTASVAFIHQGETPEELLG